MSLSKYKSKRSFDKTPEPTGGKPVGNQFRFVVQKHHASHLHYDFRLEMEGVLKSWAVPKGPSMNPDDKRLAMMVEDHPWDYRDFEGIIPSGYGAGTVIVWDEGTYELVDKKKTKKENNKVLLHQLYQGKISFKLKGKKLKGEFTLVKTHGRGENAWLLMKHEDHYALKTDITGKDKSVISGKTIEEVQAHPAKKWESHGPKKTTQNKAVEKGEEDEVIKIPPLIKEEKKSPFPKDIKPMLCTLVKEPFEDPDYLYELKLDGYRIIAFVQKEKVVLKSRSGLDYTKKYPIIATALQSLNIDAVLDGEIVALNEKGQPDFDALQKNDGSLALAYYAFDILFWGGYNLMELTFEKRKQILAESINFNEIIKYSEHFENGLELFDLVKKQQMEGIVAKKKSSTYQPGKRNSDWLKMPTEKRQEFVIGGWTDSEKGTPFASLLFGYYEGKKLIYQGHAGGGFKEKEKKDILKKLQSLEIKKSPFANEVDSDRNSHWVKPKLVANIKFATYTASGKIRKPAIFLGFREDKRPGQVVKETAVDPEEIEEKNDKKKENGKDKQDTAALDNWYKIAEENITSHADFEIDGHKITLTNIEKPLWKNVTKSRLIEYYHTIAPYILPYLKDRPQSLHIKNINSGAPGFYIKDMRGHQPKWAEIFTIKRKHPQKNKSEKINYLVCQDEATLLYMVNLGCIDINPWTSRIQDYKHPDYIIIDLDPSDEDFSKVIKTTIVAKKVLDRLKITSFVKTSGKTGIHLYLPCENFSFAQSRSIAENICNKIHEKIPDITTTEISVDHRSNKLYIDPNQNDEADTVAAPYSVRPAGLPIVSTPLDWKEIKNGLDFTKFTIDTVSTRIEKKGDLFKGVFDPKIKISNSISLKKLL